MAGRLSRPFDRYALIAKGPGARRPGASAYQIQARHDRTFVLPLDA